jgi:hypothetical protein
MPRRKSRRKVLLTYDEALKLGAGDILLVNGIARMIIEGPRDRPPPVKKISFGHPAIYFHLPIHRRSWTNRPYTCVLWNDLKFIARIPRKKLDVRTFAEVERHKLESIGFKIDFEVNREIEEERKRIERIKNGVYGDRYRPDEVTPSVAGRFVKMCCRMHGRKGKS